MKKNIFYFLTFFIITSCAVENVNLSPISNLSTGVSSKSEDKILIDSQNNIEAIKYSSDITNILTQIPKFTDNAVNKEISKLKFSLSEYIFAIKENNEKGRARALKNYEKSYKRIQNLREKLSTEDDEILNRYMVRIKTNMTMLQNL